MLLHPQTAPDKHHTKQHWKPQSLKATMELYNGKWGERNKESKRAALDRVAWDTRRPPQTICKKYMQSNPRFRDVQPRSKMAEHSLMASKAYKSNYYYCVPLSHSQHNNRKNTFSCNNFPFVGKEGMVQEDLMTGNHSSRQRMLSLSWAGKSQEHEPFLFAPPPPPPPTIYTMDSLDLKYMYKV